MGHLYRVDFFKKLVDSTGHPFDVPQGIVEVRGDTKSHAIEKARRKFAQIKSVRDWSLRADYEVVNAVTERGGVAKVGA
jgi:hypothetical protein